MKNLTKAPKPDFWQHHFKTMRPNFLKLTAFLTKDERLRLKKCNFRLKIHGQAMLGTVQYVAQYPDGTSTRTLETRTQFLRGPFQLSVNKVFRMKAEHFSFKMKVLAI